MNGWEIDRFERSGFELVVYEINDQESNFEGYEANDTPPGPDDPEETHELYQTRLEEFGVYWWYVGIVVEARFPLEDGRSVELGSDSLWGIESDCREHIYEEIIPDVTQEAMEDAKRNLSRIVEKVAESATF